MQFALDNALPWCGRPAASTLRTNNALGPGCTVSVVAMLVAVGPPPMAMHDSDPGHPPFQSGRGGGLCDEALSCIGGL